MKTSKYSGLSPFQSVMYARIQKEDSEGYNEEISELRNINRSAKSDRRGLKRGMSEIEKNRMRNTISQLDYIAEHEAPTPETIE